MFKICSLTLFDKDNRNYTYKFYDGINYFRASNSKGKTLFYNYIDYMLGEELNTKMAGIDKIVKCHMIVEKDNQQYEMVRTLNKNINYFSEVSKENLKPIDSNEYKQRLNVVFSPTRDRQLRLREFMGENISFRQFVIFSFLGENRQGQLQNFWDKSTEIKFSVRLPQLMNYIFNPNLEKIHNLIKKIEDIQKELENSKVDNVKRDFLLSEINYSLRKLGISTQFNGINKSEIKNQLNQLRNFNTPKNTQQKKSITEILAQISSIDEQIKVHKNNLESLKLDEKINLNRQQMLQNLHSLVSKTPEYKYLTEPVIEVLKMTETTLAFTDYLVSDTTYKALEKQKSELVAIAKNQEMGLTAYSLEEKQTAINFIDQYIDQDILSTINKNDDLKKNVKKLRDKLRKLQNQNDETKLRKLSDRITELYFLAKDGSEFVKEDWELGEFSIEFIKNGCLLQPIISNDRVLVGSKARKTLIQLCGYIAFLELLITEEKYPEIPILVLDHISKDFSEDNQRSLGMILNSVIKNGELQIIMFDDKRANELGLKVSVEEELDIPDLKTGFNPFI